MPPAMENVKAITTRGGKTTQDPPYPNHVNRKKASPVTEEPPREEEPEKVHEGKTTPHEFYDTHVPTYARYIKDIINKRPLPTTEVIKLTEACNAAVLQQLLEKKKDPGFPTIRCSIGAQNFDKALCDLGASVSVMPKAVFDQLNYIELTPTPMQLQLADSLVRHPEGIPEDVLVRVRGCFIPVDFVVLDMDNQKKTTLNLGWPFLNTAYAHIDVRAREIRLHINGKEEKFDF
ncbi:uncharacterized protein LOC120709820 [Panicum virgatum]|uniref:uncharacterized protein LOC120709820 n=1 Tax=Panicum virgatum TaxID=38727 RepID=UPI0019D6A9B1|nr:uncharacterized protein LOC120709820 [Panicum virgatum]